MNQSNDDLGGAYAAAWDEAETEDPGVIYRMRIYTAVPENLPAFHAYFRDWLLPVQLRHGARLVGRWETDDHRVVAVWEYDSPEAYERVDAAVRSDPDFALAQQHRTTLPPLFTSRDEVFMRREPG
jgi:NIPSNAP protein